MLVELAWLPLAVIAYDSASGLLLGVTSLAFLTALASASARLEQGRVPVLHPLLSLWLSLPGTLGYFRDRWMLVDLVLEARKATITVNGEHVEGVRFDANLIQETGTNVQYLMDKPLSKEDRLAFEAAVAAARESRGDTTEVPPSLHEVRRQTER